MTSLQTALWAAFLALIGKVVFDLFARYRDRQSVAGAVAGELRASIDLLGVPDTWTRFRYTAALDRAERVSHLRAFPTLPSTHPVFDRISDRIGRLPVSVAGEVSRTYNIVTGLRLMITDTSSIAFCETDDAVQSARLTFIADKLELELPRSLSLIQSLALISEQSFLSWLLRFNPLPLNFE